jgi:hypothetical protein
MWRMVPQATAALFHRLICTRCLVSLECATLHCPALEALFKTREAAEDGGKANHKHLVVLASGDRNRVLRP